MTEVETRYPEPSRHAGKCLRTSPAGLTIRSGNLRTALEPTSPRVGFRRPAAQLICGALVRWRASPSERSCCSVSKPQPQWPPVRSTPWTPCLSRSIPGDTGGHTEWTVRGMDQPRRWKVPGLLPAAGSRGCLTTASRRPARIAERATRDIRPAGRDLGRCSSRRSPRQSWSMLPSCR